MCGYCNGWECVCVGIVMCGSVCVCGCFDNCVGNMCTCIYCVLYCVYCVFVLFHLCVFILICFVCTSVKDYCHPVTNQLQIVVVVVVVVVVML